MEPMNIFYANNHVSSNSMKDCKDDQDWDGKMFIVLLKAKHC